MHVLAASGNYGSNSKYTILSAASGLSGTFANATSNLAFLAPSLGYDANNVYLTLALNGTIFPDIALTPNQRAVASGLAALPTNNPIYTALLSLDAASARRAFDSLSGEIHASARSVMLDDSRYLRDAVTDRLRQASTPDADSLAALNASAAACKTAAASDLAASAACNTTPSRVTSVWGQTYGSQGRLGSDGNAASVDRSSTGFIVGADTALNETWRVGVASGVSSSAFDTSANNASSTIDSYHVALYGGAQLDDVALRMGTAYSWNRVQVNRSINFGDFSGNPSANYGAGTAQIFGEAGYATALGPVALEPFAGLAYVVLHTNGFAEDGGVSALTGDEDTQNLAYSTLGVRAATRFELGSQTTLMPRAMVGWRHAFGALSPTARMAFTGSPTTFSIAGVPLARDSAVVELGVDISVGKNATLGFSYAGQYGSGYRDNAIQGSVLWKF
ncbi:autotransporter outer membrane beta-barrel domain-containing protein [Paraburkholderia hayleyella]|uniref:autotransporter outer membrane beta-barrel domain-containing protein n=1 Tax=Paraburkholderia hayleyella TaxID=2152889 RepID=UPI0012910DDF|nr:autotransporter domain-containing protein [Paraburkholderia hayleyella]